MRTVALISGGKDSCFNMMQCVAEGHEIVALANLKPADKDELDSYMYQTVGHHAIELYAEAMGLPLFRHTILGSSKQTDRVYTPTPDDEVEDLLQLLHKVKKAIDFEAVSVGAILSDYQRVRVENVCQRLGVTSLAYLWRRDQSELLGEMVDCGVSAVIIKVASWGLHPDRHLGKNITELLPELRTMSEKYQLNICGEGGEYETFTLDCPLFKKKIVLDEVEQVIHSTDPYSPVGYLNLRLAHLVDKPEKGDRTQREMIDNLCMKRSCDIQKELMSVIPDRPQVLMCTVKTHTQNIGPESALSADHPVTVRTRGDNLYMSGVIATYSEDEDILTATAAAMNKLRDRVAGVGDGWDITQLVLVCLYAQKMEDFAQINSMYQTYFGVNPPARVCVQACLPSNVLFQIDCYGNKGTDDRSTMHVQSISHWASANIGPYSQAVQIGDRIYVAGQIALVPGSMQIIDGGVTVEGCLALRHADRILAAKSSGCNLCNVVSAICYVTSHSYIDRAKEVWKCARKPYKADKGDHSGEDTMGVVYVVVPRLPRDACVEWQLVACTESDSVEEQVTSHTESGYMTVMKCATDSSAFHCMACTEIAETCSSLVSMKDAVCSFCTCYKKATKDISSYRSTVLRVFYKASQFDYNHLYSCFVEQLKDSDVETFVLVPVVLLCNSSTVLSACQ